jgi:hypothetical protein
LSSSLIPFGAYHQWEEEFARLDVAITKPTATVGGLHKASHSARCASLNDTRTRTIRGKDIQTFQTAGEFKLEAVGEPNREVNYAYVLLGGEEIEPKASKAGL